MSKLNDYSGPFDAALTIDDLSAECLTKLMKQWAAAYVRLDEAWASLLKPKVSANELYETEKQVWMKVAAITLPKIAKAMNIEVKSIVDVMKVWQLVPDGAFTGSLYDSAWEVKNPNHVIWRVDVCRTREYYEKRNDPDRMLQVCYDVCTPVVTAYLTPFFPDVQVTPLKRPTGIRKDLTEKPACVWEIKRAA